VGKCRGAGCIIKTIKEAAFKAASFCWIVLKSKDLFHQYEFEQASYMYLDIIETRTDIAEAWRGICASYYFMGKYDEAVAACLNIHTYFGSTFADRFVKGCEGKIVGEDEIVKEKQVQMVPQLI
jgi:hypothetical protein